MKIYLLGLISLLGLTNYASAFTLTCRSEFNGSLLMDLFQCGEHTAKNPRCYPGGNMYPEGYAGLVNFNDIYCKTSDGKTVSGLLSSFGAGLLTNDGSFKISCPLTSNKKFFERYLSGKLTHIITAEAQVGFAGTLKAGMGFSRRASPCFVAGVGEGYGAEAGVHVVKLVNLEARLKLLEENASRESSIIND